LLRIVGRGLLAFAPRLMKLLTIAGTAAMFLVGGGILTHGIPALHHWIEQLTARAAAIVGIGGTLKWLGPLLADAAVGVAAGAMVLIAVSLVRKVWPGRGAAPESV
jgi:predicted DNA repair protein MutK